MKRVLVTGSSGFIGRHTLGLLRDRGYDTHGCRVDLLEATKPIELVEEVRPTHLVHFAWCTRPPDYLGSPENLQWVGASLALVEAFARCGGRRVVVAGTCAEYDANAGVCKEEETPLMQTTLYGTCKHGLRLVTERFCREAGVSHAWGRIFYVYGPYEHPGRLIPLVIRSLLAGKPVECPAGDELRDYLYVEDVASAFAALLDSDVQGPVNVGSGQAVATRVVLETIARKIGRADLLRLRPDPTAPVAVIADVRRLREDLGWSPAHTLDLGLTKTIEWWRRS